MYHDKYINKHTQKKAYDLITHGSTMIHYKNIRRMNSHMYMIFYNNHKLIHRSKIQHICEKVVMYKVVTRMYHD